METTANVATFVLGILGIAAVFLAYFLPSFVATVKKHKHVSAITIFNLLLGWTFVGWAIALVWAFMDQPREPPQWMKDRYG